MFWLEVVKDSGNQVDVVADKEIEELSSSDLRRRLGKKSMPSQSDNTNLKEEASTTDVTTETERIVVRYVSIMCTMINAFCMCDHTPLSLCGNWE